MKKKATDPDELGLFVRRSDPIESALSIVRVKIGNDRKECFILFSALILDPRYPYATRKIFEFEYLIDLRYSAVRADSLTRRLSDIVLRTGNRLPKMLHLFAPSGKRWGGSAILVHTDWGTEVAANPELMVFSWDHKAIPNEEEQ